jgi:hypothetical protein
MRLALTHAPPASARPLAAAASPYVAAAAASACASSRGCTRSSATAASGVCTRRGGYLAAQRSSSGQYTHAHTSGATSLPPSCWRSENSRGCLRRAAASGGLMRGILLLGWVGCAVRAWWCGVCEEDAVALNEAAQSLHRSLHTRARLDQTWCARSRAPWWRCLWGVSCTHGLC